MTTDPADADARALVEAWELAKNCATVSTRESENWRELQYRNVKDLITRIAAALRERDARHAALLYQYNACHAEKEALRKKRWWMRDTMLRIFRMHCTKRKS